MCIYDLYSNVKQPLRPVCWCCRAQLRWLMSSGSNVRSNQATGALGASAAGILFVRRLVWMMMDWYGNIHMYMKTYETVLRLKTFTFQPSLKNWMYSEDSEVWCVTVQPYPWYECNSVRWVKGQCVIVQLVCVIRMLCTNNHKYYTARRQRRVQIL